MHFNPDRIPKKRQRAGARQDAAGSARPVGFQRVLARVLRSSGFRTSDFRLEFSPMLKLPLITPMLLLIAASCTMAPKYSRPEPPVPAAWPGGPAHAAPGAATNALQLDWPEFFVDTKLQQLIQQALRENRDLRVAALNAQEAQALYGIRRADLFPVVNATAAGSRQRIPADVLGLERSGTFSQYSVSLGAASWELDFFGRIRSLKDRALQEYLASEQARRSAQIALVSAVANAYLALAADRESLRLAETTLVTQQDAYNLIQRRHTVGLSPELDLFRAQAQVDAARGDLARFKQFAAQDENALQLLLGAPIPRDLLPTDLAGVKSPAEVRAGLSSAVLLERPDVLQAEDLLKAAYADLGAARAAFFPRISLTAAVGTASGELSGLFKSGSGTWSYAPQIVMPIFDARTWSAAKAAKVQREMAVAQYERAIQNAFRDVADALAVRGTIGQQVAAQESLVHAVAETYRLSNSRYDRGIDSYLSVLDAQRSLYAAQQGLVSLRLANLTSQVRLYAVLGGGWQSAKTDTADVAKPSH
jgi:outer membrane protein, multidrug efflux system